MSNNVSLSSLLQGAGVDDETGTALQLAADTLGPAIMAGLGDITLDDINTSEVVLVTQLLDDSGSIRMTGGNAQLVREGHNLMLDALLGSKQAGEVLISCRYLNDDPPTVQGVLYPYVTLQGAKRLDKHNYDPRGGTPLYDQTAVTLAGVVAKMSEFEQGGVAARAITVIVTDGADAGSYRQRAADIYKIVTGLLRTEQHIIAGMGICDAPTRCYHCGTDTRVRTRDAKCPNCHAQIGTNFTEVFKSMGIPDEWILTPGNTSSEIRAAFQTVSQSAVRASQTANFSQVALGGFSG